jgi:hypothetical protein
MEHSSPCNRLVTCMLLARGARPLVANKDKDDDGGGGGSGGSGGVGPPAGLS